jgi:hypothetical protein
VSCEQVDLLVAQLRRIARAATLEFALNVGRVIIHNFYGGYTSGWRLKGPKPASFRRLAEHPDLPFSAGTLYRCVAVFELCERMNAPTRWPRLTASHLRLVLGLSPATQEKLLALANSNGWTVKCLQDEVHRIKSEQVARGGRRRQSPLAKGLKTIRKCIRDHKEMVHQVAIDAEDVVQTKHFVREMKEWLDCLSQALDAPPPPSFKRSG